MHTVELVSRASDKLSPPRIYRACGSAWGNRHGTINSPLFIGRVPTAPMNPCDDSWFCRQSGNYQWRAAEYCLKTNLTPFAPISSHKSNAAPLDLQSWILVVPLVSHVSECSTIRTAFALPRRNDNGAETSTRLAEKGKARSRRNLSIILPH